MKYHSFKLEKLFIVKSGNYHSAQELESGDTPLISCGDYEQGLVGYYDIPEEDTYRHCITVAYNGKPLTSKYHSYRFAAKDDIAVLIPRTSFSKETLYYTAAMINQLAWRYNYGRKCFREKLKRISILFPSRKDGSIDEDEIKNITKIDPVVLIPAKKHFEFRAQVNGWREWNITSLFNVYRGNFHSLADLDSGRYMTVSRITSDNGLVGYYDKPNGAILYPAGSITVSTVGGDAFVQLNDFIATDNVLILRPQITLRSTTCYFIAFMLNRQKWRYSYGRQCYLTKFRMLKLYLPVDKNGQLHEDLMEKIVESSPYWHSIRNVIVHGGHV